MPAELVPLRRIKCTYPDCFESFDTEKQMKNHKKNSDEHEYCTKCDEDFEDFEAFAFHKILAPLKHDKACRICGDEFKSISGHRRHVEMNHKINQRLTCIGCHETFPCAFLLIEHLEFGHCNVISQAQFQGHVIHKHLITEYLKGGEALVRFEQKQAKFEAAIDCDEQEGGVSLGDQIFDDEEIEDVKFQAIKPDTPPYTPVHLGTYPPLPSQMNSVGPTKSDISSLLDQLSMTADLEASATVVNSPVGLSTAATFPVGSSQGSSSRQVSSAAASKNLQSKVWSSRDGKSASSALFPGAKPTPVTEDFSIVAHDENMKQEHGANIMRTRFWDPDSSDWTPDRFFDVAISQYYCPFVCEQTFADAGEQRRHIMEDHRITRMKCPMCLKYFKSATALMAHCESRGARCEINKADDFSIFLDRISGGFLGVQEKTRPDHLNNPSTLLHNEETGRMEHYRPPVANYLQYSVTKPPDWKEPVRSTVIGGVAMQPRVRW
ncbi:hypothetical protein HBI23_230290 [Parastagonospora nodorum]|nr:hypothetical protein HBH96_221930 [Parastagonospora nodorum]KAH5430907.1 hypothetical protein HBI47_110320 [Parastagonospora nodorum]KAH5625874.1 hypothetical protein HBI23_230290 [Parastagonospora nodorum]KAH6373004.1 hypothetical protein HBI34_088820 [Parastagonospora nodorum]